MNINFSYDKEFDELFDSLKEKYGNDIFDVDGIGFQLDINTFSKDFFGLKTTTADVSVDANSNVDTKDSVSYLYEVPKPFMRMNSYYLLWKKLKSLYDLNTANDIIEKQLTGSIYINDFSDISRPYCYNYSMYDIALEGLPMVKKIRSIAPKYLTAFKSQVEQFVVIASNSILGASGLADLLIVMSWYVDKALETLSDAHVKFKSEEDVWKYAQESLASLIYTVNQPNRSGVQCVTEDTDVLTPSGFKTYDLLSEGDEIYTWQDGELKISKILRMNVSDYNGEMHQYYGDNALQVVTPNHKVLNKQSDGHFRLTTSSNLINSDEPIVFPVAMLNDCRGDYSVSSNDLLNITFNDDSVTKPDWLYSISRKQAEIIVSNLTGYSGIECTKSNLDSVQHLVFLTGKQSIVRTEIDSDTKEESFYVIISDDILCECNKKKKIHYEGKVWCPTTDDGVVVFRKDNKLFVSGNSPFTNVSVYDDNFLKSLLKDGGYMIDGRQPKIETIKKLQDVYLNVMNNEMKRTQVTFPVTTACFAIDDDNEILDDEFALNIAKIDEDNAFINMYSGKTSTLSSCCRLRSDNSDKEYFNAFGSGSTKLGCYDDKTEVLTSNGWKLFKDVDIYLDRIFSMDDSCNPSFVKADEFHKYEFNGNLIGFNSSNVDILVTPNHRMLYMTNEDNSYEVMTADKIIEKKNFKIPMNKCYKENVISCGEVYKLNDCITVATDSFIKLVALYMSAGYLTHDSITIEVNSEQPSDSFNKIYALLKSMDVIFTNDAQGFYIDDTRYVSYFESNFLHKELSKINTFPVNYRNMFWDWMVIGNGTHSTVMNDTLKINIDSRDLADDIQTLLAINGYRSKVELCVDDPENKFYKITKFIRKLGKVSSYEYSKNPYNGHVYCLSVPDGTLFIRRNGITNWSGNSIGVVTMNLPRAAIIAKRQTSTNEEASEKFLELLNELVIIASKINNAKRKIIKKRIDNERMPLYNKGFMTIKSQYSTAGVTGLNEVCEILGYDVLSENGQNFLLHCMDIMNKTSEKLKKKYDAPHNVEQVPAENSSIKLAKKDKMMGFQDGKYKLYSNQFIPLTTKADVLDRIKIQGLLDSHFSGGAICHINAGSRLSSDQIYNLIKYCAKKGVVYWALNYNINRCVNGHMSVGKTDKCEICGGEIEEVFTRVVGFLTSVKNWHQVRRENDYPNRQWYNGDIGDTGKLNTSIEEK